ncbi:MAG: pyruvate, phosphate dikinase [Rhodomicrobium sp.]|nr:MAG: pyruvate, phosphate dikinase [Rhodomicrobium sp.]
MTHDIGQAANSNVPKWVYSFGGGSADGSADDRNLLGGKGANLAEMASIGLPVPPGFTITTEVCGAFYDMGKRLPDGLKEQVKATLDEVGRIVGAEYGSVEKPLLVSVRSGARVSMPGMMDTVLNLGLNDETVEGLAKRSGDRRFAYDSYRRFIQMYASVVLEMEHDLFEDILESYKNLNGFARDTELAADDWAEIISQYKEVVTEHHGAPFPTDVYEQLWGAISAVFLSWHSRRAATYRMLHDIDHSWGTAVNVQAMVFGNMGENSATGVAFTRNPSTGENELYGEFLINAQGEDVVAGIRTPQPLTLEARLSSGDEELPSLEEAMPKAFEEFKEIVTRLETHYRDCQDIEFTIEDGKLWMLQTRSGKRTSGAAIKMAVDMVAEGLINRDEAILRIEPQSLDQLLHPTIDPAAPREVITRGLPASPGAAAGMIVFDADEAEKQAGLGKSVLLVRIETSPEDIHGMHAAKGILTARGGMTSHAAVVARGMGRPCVSGAGAMRIDAAAKTLRIGGLTLNEGDLLTIDGSTGEVLKGEQPMRQAEMTGDFGTLMQWADDVRRLRVRANAETGRETELALKFGAEGIGLCRTEHMFFETSRITAMREMILARDEEGRRAALSKLLPMQRSDFVELFTLMEGLPVTIRLLDPPLHEFLPHDKEEIEALAALVEMDAEDISQRVEELKEFNPMLGHRGCRLAISYPEITEMQTRAIFEAALEVSAAGGEAVRPEIMVPLIATGAELDHVKAVIDKTAEEVFSERGSQLDYDVGTMIELPRAALQAGDIAERAAFFSFGTNDLTQTTFGISRDDASPILNKYVSVGILRVDPFASLDQSGVGKLVEMAAQSGREVKETLKLGICGEHGGDPNSIDFFERVGLDYVSCSPFRVPVARLAAAQAFIKHSDTNNAADADFVRDV